MTPLKELLLKLNETPEFQVIMEELIKQRPIVPKWSPDGGELLMERIKFEMARQDGFDLLKRLLTGK